MPPTADHYESTEDEQIRELRNLVADELTPWYDTRYNLLRWLQSNDFNMSKSAYLLKRHLRWRKARNLDCESSLLQRSEVTEIHAPLTFLGRTHEDDSKVMVIDRAGLVDVPGVMKSVQPTEYIHNMFRTFEKLLRQFMEIEKETSRQSFVYYVFDLDGLPFDPTVVSVINGPYRVTWQLTAMHYRNFIDKFLIVNAPSYLNMLWSAISPLIPEEARKKFVFTENKTDLLHYIHPDRLPKMYGGNLCDSVLNIPTRVPQELYWKPKEHYPSLNELHKISISAGKTRTLTFHAKAHSTILMYSQNDDDITVTLLYSENENASDEELEVLVPPVPKCGLKAMDCFDYYCEANGFYHIRLSNEAAWLLSSVYRMLVHDSNGSELPLLQKEKWIKRGIKAKK